MPEDRKDSILDEDATGGLIFHGLQAGFGFDNAVD